MLTPCDGAVRVLRALQLAVASSIVSFHAQVPSGDFLKWAHLRKMHLCVRSIPMRAIFLASFVTACMCQPSIPEGVGPIVQNIGEQLATAYRSRCVSSFSRCPRPEYVNTFPFDSDMSTIDEAISRQAHLAADDLAADAAADDLMQDFFRENL